MKISSASEMAEAFNCHFANIGHDLAREIPSAYTVPESYLISTNAPFSFKSCSPNEVRKLLEKLETKKSTALDNLSSKMLKRECPRGPREITKMWHMLEKLISLIFC